MRIEIQDGAEKDLVEGFEFYERQSVGGTGKLLF